MSKPVTERQADNPIIPGLFFKASQPGNPETPKAWLQAFGYDSVPWDYDMEVPLGFRIHNRGKDIHYVMQILKAAEGLGYTPHVNWSTIEAYDSLEEDWVKQIAPNAVCSVGNSTDAKTTVKSGVIAFSEEIQDDSGIVGATYIKGKNLRDLPQGIHCYGGHGFHPDHLHKFVEWFGAEGITIMECHVGFPKHPLPKRAREDLLTAENGAYCRWVMEEAAKHKIPVCMFYDRSFFKSTGEHEESLKALTGELKGVERFEPGIGKVRAMRRKMFLHVSTPLTNGLKYKIRKKT